eukprot:CAMPEP_0194405836 /NCGR_PEP_ID=MMETSP0176-20130528/4162_1 /TAXON_ID=216777 /ORGANISM="Proboscia alata, Strain PI-D3" /LENGTH=734 /DNA_ID=CAMNT_0039204807 /DNA_START=38 /DNA_END=2242 /DNA_ORIENTATION=+
MTNEDTVTTSPTPSPPSSIPKPLLPIGLTNRWSPSTQTTLTSSPILLVGSGGIGCELLKNLALTGFRNVEIIDLDTIDVSNLNRQFLFRSSHVGKPKCVVAAQAAMDMCPYKDAKYIAHHGNVKDSTRFPPRFFQKFKLCLNALDNIDARRHVNRACLAASLPLIEAGTTGYLGQTTVISKEAGTECFECQVKPAQKVYPICTIRSTPSMPVHTIVWAKELWKLCFGGGEGEGSMLYEDPSLEGSSEDGESNEVELKDGAANTNETAETEPDPAKDSKSVYMEAVQQKPSNGTPNQSTLKECDTYAETLIKALYTTEVQKQLDMDRYKTAQKKPTPLDPLLIRKGCTETPVPNAKQHMTAWTPIQCVAVLTSVFHSVYSIQTPTNNQPFPNGEFDKDDALAMQFICAASNLRSHVFGIDMQSLYEAKGIAGNIIPAIATTNAIVAGLQMIQVLKILSLQQQTTQDPPQAVDTPPVKKLTEVCHYIYCQRNKNRKGYYLQPTTLPSPNPHCFVCSKATISLELDTTTWIFCDLVKTILKKRLGFSEPSVTVGDAGIWEEGEDADDCYAVNLKKILCDLPGNGMKDGTTINIEDFSQDLSLDICIIHRSEWDEETEPDQFRIIGGGEEASKPACTEIPTADAKKVSEETDKTKKNDEEDDDCVIENPPSSNQTVDKTGPNTNEASKKRPRDVGTDALTPPSKKQILTVVEKTESNDGAAVKTNDGEPVVNRMAEWI